MSEDRVTGEGKGEVPAFTGAYGGKVSIAAHVLERREPTDEERAEWRRAPAKGPASPADKGGERGYSMTEFVFLGRTYRTNADASVVEGLDGATWNRTGSLSVRQTALETLAKAKTESL